MKYSACASASELDVPGYYLLLPKTDSAPGCWCHHSRTHTVPFPQSGHQNLGILSSYQEEPSHINDVSILQLMYRLGLKPRLMHLTKEEKKKWMLGLVF